MDHTLTAKLSNIREIGPVYKVMITPSEATIKILKQSKKRVPLIKVLAIIDTGASSTAVSQRVVKKLQLVSRGTAKVFTSARKSEIRNEFDVSLRFSNHISLHILRALEANLRDQKIDCIVGRDVLEHGIFIYDGPRRKFTLMFST